jgi:hypothetical protein
MIGSRFSQASKAFGPDTKSSVVVPSRDSPLRRGALKQMEALTGCARDELIGARFKDCFTDPHRAGAAIKLVFSEKRVTNCELTARARDGKETVVSYNAVTFYESRPYIAGRLCCRARHD